MNTEKVIEEKVIEEKVIELGKVSEETQGMGNLVEGIGNPAAGDFG